MKMYLKNSRNNNLFLEYSFLFKYHFLKKNNYHNSTSKSKRHRLQKIYVEKLDIFRTKYICEEGRWVILKVQL